MPTVVVDTNVWVSAFLNPKGAPARLWGAGKGGRYAIVTSAPLLGELFEVLCRPRIMRVRGTSVAEAEAFVQGLAAAAELVPVTGARKLCRDPDDDWVLETAAVGHATHLVSRDEDVTRDRALVDQLERRGVRIVTVRRFLAILGEHESPQEE